MTTFGNMAITLLNRHTGSLCDPGKESTLVFAQILLYEAQHRASSELRSPHAEQSVILASRQFYKMKMFLQCEKNVIVLPGGFWFPGISKQRPSWINEYSIHSKVQGKLKDEKAAAVSCLLSVGIASFMHGDPRTVL